MPRNRNNANQNSLHQPYAITDTSGNSEGALPPRNHRAQLPRVISSKYDYQPRGHAFALNHAASQTLTLEPTSQVLDSTSLSERLHEQEPQSSVHDDDSYGVVEQFGSRRMSRIPQEQLPRGSLLRQAPSDRAVKRIIESHRIMQPEPGHDILEEETNMAGPCHRLSVNAAMFAQIPLGDYKSCLTFVANYPDVLNEDQKSLQAAAMMAYQQGLFATGDQLVDRLTFIYHCQTNHLSVKNSLSYINDLSIGQSNSFVSFQRNYETIRDHLRTKAPSYAQSTTVPVSRVTTAREIQPSMSQVTQRSRTSTSEDLQQSADAATGFTTSQSRRLLPTATPYVPNSATGSDAGLTEGLRNVQISPIATSRSIARPLSDSTTATSLGNPFWPGANNPFVPAVDRDNAPHHQPPTPYIDPDAQLELLTIGGPLRADFRPRNTLIAETGEGSYAPRIQDAKNFFARGRIFKMWWHEPVGKKAGTEVLGKAIQDLDGNKIYSKKMFMVVIHSKKGYAICCPISTYGEHGLTKPGLDAAECMAHAIIYSEGQKPQRLRREPVLSKEPIKVKTLPTVPPLHPASRVHFGMSHTVHWDASIMDIGRVVAEHRDFLSQYFVTEHVR